MCLIVEWDSNLVFSLSLKPQIVLCRMHNSCEIQPINYETASRF